MLLELRRLSSAGIEIRADDGRLLIDPLEDAAPLGDVLGAPRVPLVPVTTDGETWALVTHLHADHCDRGLLRRLPARHVFCHSTVAEELASEGVDVTGVRLWESVDLGPYRATAVPSHDWRGSDQIAWVIEVGGRRFIHCGDTIWHGSWWEIERRCGPFDVAFLPINGVVVQLEGFTATDVPATMTPEQAIEAAAILRAQTACAIHYGLFDNPPKYAEQPDVVGRFLAAAKRRNVQAVVPAAGERVPLRT